MNELNEAKEKQSNQQPISEWHCDIYCRKIRHVDCEGKEHVNPDSPNMCPYFDEMLY